MGATGTKTAEVAAEADVGFAGGEFTTGIELLTGFAGFAGFAPTALGVAETAEPAWGIAAGAGRGKG